MARERTTIEIFFEALGHPDVKKALESIARGAADADEKLGGVGKAAERANIGKKLRDQFAGAVREQQTLAKELRRLQVLGEKGIITPDEQLKLQRLHREFAELGRQIGQIRGNGKDILSPDELRAARRLSEEYARLKAQLRDIRNQPGGPAANPRDRVAAGRAAAEAAARAQREAAEAAARAQREQDAAAKKSLRDRFAAATREQAALAREMRRLQTLGERGLISPDEARKLQRLVQESRQLGIEIGRIQNRGRRILDPNEVRDVRRLGEEYGRLRRQIQEIRNQPPAPTNPGEQLSRDLAKAITDARKLHGEIQRLENAKRAGPLSQADLARLEVYREQYRRLGTEIQRIQRGSGSLGRDDLLRLRLLRQQWIETGGAIDNVDKKVRRFITSEQAAAAAAKVLEGSLRGVDKALTLAGGAALRGTVGGLRSSASFASLFVRNLGGSVPVLSAINSGVKTIYGGMQRAAFATLGMLGSLYGINRFFDSLREANDDMTGLVLALRSFNNEASATAPLLVANPNGPGLYDAAGVSLRNTAKEFEFLNKVAYENGLVTADVGRGYVRLKAALQGTGITAQATNDLISGLGAAKVVTGLSQDNIDRAITALSQIGSKGGRVMSEELKGQLAEAIPGTFALAAKAYNVPVDVFTSMLKRGDIKAEEFIPRFGSQLLNDYGTKAKSLSNTTRIAFGRMKNEFVNAKVAITSGRLDQTFARLLNSVSKLLGALSQSGAFQRFGAKLALTLERIVGPLERVTASRAEAWLDKVAKGFDYAVVGGQIAIDMLRELVGWIGQLTDVAKGYGFSGQGIINSLHSLAGAVDKAVFSFRSGTFTDNPFSNFLAALASAIVETVHTIGTLSGGTLMDGVDSISDAFQRAAYWLGQFALAMRSLSTGEIAPGLDKTGEGILTNLILAIDKVRELKAQLTGVGALLSGGDAPADAKPGMRNAFGYRGALGNLVTGKDNTAINDAQGKQIYDPKDLELLFNIRDIVKGLVDFIIANKGAIKGFAEGVLAVVGAVASLVDGLKNLGLGSGAGYLLGITYALSKIPGSTFLAKAAFEGLSSAFTALNGTMTALIARFGLLSVATAGVGAASLVGIFVSIYRIVTLITNNFALLKAEIGNIVDLLKAGLTDALASFIRSFGQLLSYIPGVGDRLQNGANNFADELSTGAELTRSQVRARQIDEYLRQRRAGENPLEANYSWMIGAQQEAAQTAAVNDNALAAASGSAAVAPQGFIKPVQIFLSDGTAIDVMAKESDAATFEQLAARTARNRAGNASAWAG